MPLPRSRQIFGKSRNMVELRLLQTSLLKTVILDLTGVQEKRSFETSGLSLRIIFLLKQSCTPAAYVTVSQ